MGESEEKERCPEQEQQSGADREIVSEEQKKEMDWWIDFMQKKMELDSKHRESFWERQREFDLRMKQREEERLEQERQRSEEEDNVPKKKRKKWSEEDTKLLRRNLWIIVSIYAVVMLLLLIFAPELIEKWGIPETLLIAYVPVMGIWGVIAAFMKPRREESSSNLLAHLYIIALCLIGRRKD